jgi:S1-C subfamily serine protease
VLGEFLDGKGPLGERQSLEIHLRSCPSCLNRYIDLQELAVLQKEGEEPSRDLVETVKQLVPMPEPRKEATPSLVKQMAATLAAAWETLLEWTTPRFFGEVTAAVATALFLVVIGTNVFRQEPLSNGQERTPSLTDFSTTERKVLASLSAAPADVSGLQQIVETLAKFPAPPQPEETRGEKNVQTYKKAVAATVLIRTDSGLGSGSIISDRGEVLTNWHVVQGANRIMVYLRSAKEGTPDRELAFTAVPIKVDRTSDLALVQIQNPPADLQPLPLGNREDIEIGQDVHAIGHPQGEAWSYTTGDISWISPPDYEWGGENRGTVIKTGASLNPGNSGGPLLNDQAQIIGVNTFIKEGEGRNYAVAVDMIKSFLQKPAGEPPSPPSRPSPVPSLHPTPGLGSSAYRAESFGKQIIGVYIDARVPPPDAWMVYRGLSGEQPSYGAKSSRGSGQIDTVVLGEDPKWQALVHYFDTNCDGLVDLIGHDARGGGPPERYSPPPKPLHLATLASELVTAFQDGTIPYPQLRLCH